MWTRWNYHNLFLFCLTCCSWTITGTARRCILIASTFKWSHRCSADMWCRSKTVNDPKCIIFWLEKVIFSLFLHSFCLLSLFLLSSFPEWPQGVLQRWNMYDLSLQKPRVQLLGEEWCWVSVKSRALPWVSYMALDSLLRHPENARKMGVCLSVCGSDLCAQPTLNFYSCLHIYGSADGADLPLHWAEQRAEEWQPRLT